MHAGRRLRNAQMPDLSSRMWIRVAAHFQRIEARPFHFDQHAVADRALDDHKEEHSESENYDQVYGDSDQLREELARLAVEQSAHRTCNAVPSVAVSSVGE